DLMARVIQHETDHLNGIYFIDRISPLKRSFLSPKLKKLKEQALKEI
ncbi:MAG: peptide deformylase, partial [Candidatus Neomarinimicrobiota bacterium]